MINFSDIEAAHERIAPYIHRTPVLTCKSIDRLCGCSLYFKCENFQKVGAFKIRGGMNAALLLDPAMRANGLATHSSGNHAQAIALAARTLGAPAYIVMPENSPLVKVEAVRGYGGQITFCAPVQKAREAALEAVLADTGAAFIHPYDDDRVIAGQGTAVKELIEEVGTDLHAVVGPVGGGGFMSGTCLATHHFIPHAAVYAAEPEGAADAYLSMQAGRLQPAHYIDTIADGLRTTISERTFQVFTRHLEEVLPVGEADIKAALRLIWERMKIIVEPSGAVPLAAILKNKALFAGKRVGILLTGGNVDLKEVSAMMA